LHPPIAPFSLVPAWGFSVNHKWTCSL